jgi:hypothetical protein
MSDGPFWTWTAVLVLGLWHGVNPGMGWLFAVALAIQERRTSAVWRSLVPLALGHALAVGAALLGAMVLGQLVSLSELRWIVAAMLVGLGGWRLARGRHPRWVGMRVSLRDLTAWSLLMASSHGAGLMVVPFTLGPGTSAGGGDPHAAHASLLSGLGPMGEAGLWVSLAHTLGYLLATGAVALLVYRTLGLRLLGRLWVNLDLVWGAALIATGLMTPLL